MNARPSTQAITPPAERGQYTYVLVCADGSLYAGYTVDLPRRLGLHQAGKASRCTRSRLPVQLVAWWAHETQGAALRAEWAFKRQSRAAKLRALAAQAARMGSPASAPAEGRETGLATGEQGSPTNRNGPYTTVRSWV